MSNSERYHFKDFTRDNYRRLIRLAKERYLFRTFDQFGREERFVLWRHDLDFSVHAGRALARIEAEEGVTATYFLYLHSEFYNLLEREVTDAVREIIDLGHTVGVHFDCGYYSIGDEESLERMLLREKNILGDLFGRQISVFSFHNPDTFTQTCTKWQYAGLVNAYAAYFKDGIGYCSDSNGYWRYRRLEDVLHAATDERLQVLTHPAWWQERPMSPKERIVRCITGRADKTRTLYEDTLKESGREDIDW